MPNINNPFQPTRPVFSNMFMGRLAEIDRIETVLSETRDGNPTNLLFIGERGIGKTSLLILSKILATDQNFMSVFITIDRRTDIFDFARKIKTAFERELRNSDKAVQKLKDLWNFLQKVEVSGLKINSGSSQNTQSEIFDNLTYTIIDTIKTITSLSDFSKFSLREKKDGLVIFIDEADNANIDLNLGSILKQMSERMIIEGCNNVLFIVAGLPEVRNVLITSHGSALRLFEELELSVLMGEDVKEVIRRGIESANKKNKDPVVITDEALQLIVRHAEGYPHFVQQFGYSAYDVDTDNYIDKDDMKVAILAAINLIGNRYYKDMYFNKIKEDSYREVLKIMSENYNGWVTKDEIRKKFSGKETTLTNALKALNDRNIILKKAGARGTYRLQWAGFALWIYLFHK
jgi:Cdc6-like AAA superfamily ATPase